MNKLPPGTRIGTVNLVVADLDRAVQFYKTALGMQVRNLQGDTAFLGAGGEDLLILTAKPGARRVRGTTGLYHFAILVPNRLELARALARLIESRTPIGSSDHLVSEAIYLNDPDGNGIEIYRDRPKTDWSFLNGEVQMAVDPLNLHDLLAELNGEDKIVLHFPIGTRIGHMHLHVAELDQAEAFYLDLLGFERMLGWGGHVSFVSAGGYHHHIGLNTWAGIGAPPPPEDAVGLRSFEISIPGTAPFNMVIDRLIEAGVSLEKRGASYYTEDPSKNGILLTAYG